MLLNCLKVDVAERCWISEVVSPMKSSPMLVQPVQLLRWFVIYAEAPSCRCPLSPWYWVGTQQPFCRTMHAHPVASHTPSRVGVHYVLAIFPLLALLMSPTFPATIGSPFFKTHHEKYGGLAMKPFLGTTDSPSREARELLIPFPITDCLIQMLWEGSTLNHPLVHQEAQGEMESLPGTGRGVSTLIRSISR